MKMSRIEREEKIWFFDMKGDGSSLSAAKKFGPQYRNDIPKLIGLWQENRATEKPYSWFTSVEKIIENDYILSANAYNPYIDGGEKKYRDPKEILKEIEKLEKEADKSFKQIQEQL